MAWTAHKKKSQVEEHIEKTEKLADKAKELAKLIKNSKHFVVFTGAGVSTSAGIPDFRGPQGVWTLQATGGKRTDPEVDMLKAMPTSTHMSLIKLQNEGIMKYLISQNCDGLHRRSGMLPENISELHGNTNLEKCSKCNKEYLRDFDASADYETDVHDHRTGRKCDLCGGELLDSIINFGENLPEVPLSRAQEHSKKADLFLVLGSSLTVRPACKMPAIAAKNGAKLVIVNLQTTDLDDLCSIRIFGKTDTIMQQVMAHLQLDIPPFKLSRFLTITQNPKKGEIQFGGIDTDNTPVSFIRKGSVTPEKGQKSKIKKSLKASTSFAEKMNVELKFMGHYNEPSLSFMMPMAKEEEMKSVFALCYDPLTGTWEMKNSDSKSTLSIKSLETKNHFSLENNNNKL